MEQMYNKKMKELGYDQLVCEIFDNWESVKDEILIPERKMGSGNGTIHVFLGAADYELRKEFSSYYSAVENGEDPAVSAIKVTHYFLASNIISMLGYVCQYCYTENQNIGEHVNDILNTLSQIKTQKGLLTATSLFKLSLGSNKLRPYFKQFNNDGAFTRIIRKILLPDSTYKISLYKNKNNEYAAFWLFGFDWLSDFEADSSKEYLMKQKKDEIISLPLQQIFYGAPGTGKSNTIKKVVDEQGKKSYRTTFHPDSDYSTFVGCYKPTMKQEERIYSTGELIVKLKEIKTSGVTYPCHKFAAQYWKSLKDLSSEQIKEILRACDFTDSMTVEIGKGIAIGQEYLNKNEDGKIIYKFCPQAFTNAYVEAWKTDEEVYLIIEEINRGNCAQIFGDLFQLLDRKDGVSEYPIEADTDLRNHLAKELADSTRTDIPQEVMDGKILLLPNNLYIWATMNTSDQSLFPIDSAFKRRWDWQYMPICKGRDAKGEELQWAICAGDKRYDWWSFLEKINAQIGSTTNSEDKKLGYFFCKPFEGCISAETFVGKVVFYLWNDVFKDYGFDNTIFNDDEGGTLSFDKFYTTNANGKVVVCEDKVVKFLENLGVKEVEYVEEIENDSTNDFTTYSFNSSERMGKSDLGFKIMEKYITEHPEYTFNQFKTTFPDTLITDGSNSPRLKGLVVSSDVELGSYIRYYTKTDYTSSDGIKFKFFKQWTKSNIGNIIDFALKQGWSVEEVGKWDRKNS